VAGAAGRHDRDAGRLPDRGVRARHRRRHDPDRPRALWRADPLARPRQSRPGTRRCRQPQCRRRRTADAARDGCAARCLVDQSGAPGAAPARDRPLAVLDRARRGRTGRPCPGRCRNLARRERARPVAAGGGTRWRCQPNPPGAGTRRGRAAAGQHGAVAAARRAGGIRAGRDRRICRRTGPSVERTAPPYGCTGRIRRPRRRRCRMTAPAPRLEILTIHPYVGGESNLPGINRTIKLSSNEGAFGVPPGAQEAIRRVTEEVFRYPDGGADALRAAIGRRWGLNPERIVCGAGSDDIIYQLCLYYGGPGRDIVMSAHGFSIYHIAGTYAGSRVIKVPERNLTADLDAMLAAVSPATRLMFIANPNNPTGSLVPSEDVARLRAALPPEV